MTSINSIIKTALDDFYLNYPKSLTVKTDRVSIEQALQSSVSKAIPVKLTLGSDTPSFEQIYLALTQELQTVPTWTDIIPSGTGQSLLRGISAGISMLMYSVERTSQELTLRGNSESAVFNIMNMLGVRIKRNTPAKVRVRLTRPDTDTIYTIARFSKFAINNASYFNREPITFTRFDLSVEATLYQGDIYSGTALSSGLIFEKVSIGEDNKLISDEDIYVFVNGKEWSKSAVLPHEWQEEDEVFLDKTQASGNVEILFGSGVTGKRLLEGDSVNIVWAETEGALYNNSISGLVARFDAPSGIEIDGVTISSVYGGDNIKDYQFYKDVGPFIRPSSYALVRREDYRTAALNYPGVVDAIFTGQAENAPFNRYRMNIITSTILTSSTWATPQWDDFFSYINKNGIYQCEFVREDPIRVAWSIDAVIGCVPQTDLAYIESYIKEQCNLNFGLRRGSLGYSVLATDIAEVLKGTGTEKEQIETVRILSDLPPELTTKKYYLELTGVNLTIGYSTRSFNGRLDLVGGNIV